MHPLPLTSSHVLLECMVVEGTRSREGIRAFIDECARAGRSEKSAHLLFVNGKDAQGADVSTRTHLERGAALSKLTDMWLSTWGDEMEENVD